jgi:hypothetical protein
MNKTHLINHLVLSTSTIINRIWSEQEQKRYIPKTDDQQSCLSKSVVHVLFGIQRKQTVQLVKLRLSIQRHITLLRECSNICHVVSNTDATYFFTKNIAKRAYQRVIQDPFGTFRIN